MPGSKSVYQAIEVLSLVPYFGELEPSTLQVVARTASQRSYTAGQIIFQEGETCAGLCVVQDGWLKAVKSSPAGREQVLRVVSPGEVCNEIGVFADSPNPATIMALENTTVWIVPQATLLDLLDVTPSLAREITKSLASRVLHLLSLVEDLSLRTVEARLARLLLERATGGTIARRRWATQTEMAARLGTVPDVLNRALRKLVEEELVYVSRHEIKILHTRGLEAKAASEE